MIDFDSDVAQDPDIMFLFLFRIDFHVVGRSCVSSRVFDIFMALVLSKSIGCDSFATEYVLPSFRTAF